MSKIKSKKRLIGSIVFYTLFSFLVYIIILNVFIPDRVVDFAGFQLSNVQSGSMEPAFGRGDIIVLTSVDRDNIHEGDIVIYYNYVDGNYIRIVHRVVDIIDHGNELEYVTQGDANSGIDRVHPYDNPAATVPLTADMIIAKVPQIGSNDWVLRLPLIGLPFIWIGEGLTFLFANPILLILIVANLGIIIALIVIFVKGSKAKQVEGKKEDASRIKAEDVTDDDEHIRDDDEEDGSA